MESLVQSFLDIQLQMRKDEVWNTADFAKHLTNELSLPQGERQTAAYRCNIPNLETTRLVVENGLCHEPTQQDADGVVMASLREISSTRPEFVRQYFNTATPNDNPYLRLNTEHYTDGLFIYVPDGVTVQKPIQLQSVINAKHGLLLQVRNLIILGQGSNATIIHCDDSYDNAPAFANNVTEICVEADAHVEYYKMQNINNSTGLLNHTYTTLKQGASLHSVAVTLNGGHIRNHSEIRMQGEHCDVQAYGLYLNDQEQQVDNYIFIDHAHPNCHSRELFKGILDDSARATFNGHVLVQYGATKTEAYQSNKNILITDKAHIDTRPFLEIYNDDVKCSHGSTTGQLDEQTLFYIRSRGIDERTARTILLYAFCDEVLQQINLEPLRDRLVDMVKKRLHGELSACSDCALHCSTPCNGPEVNFHIDPSKL